MTTRFMQEIILLDTYHRPRMEFYSEYHEYFCKTIARSWDLRSEEFEFVVYINTGIEYLKEYLDEQLKDATFTRQANRVEVKVIEFSKQLIYLNQFKQLIQFDIEHGDEMKQMIREAFTEQWRFKIGMFEKYDEDVHALWYDHHGFKYKYAHKNAYEISLPEKKDFKIMTGKWVLIKE